LLKTVRDHWVIENALHWQLDISFREDAARNRKDNAPYNAVLRHRAPDVVRQYLSKTSLFIKHKRVGWNTYSRQRSADLGTAVGRVLSVKPTRVLDLQGLSAHPANRVRAAPD